MNSNGGGTGAASQPFLTAQKVVPHSTAAAAQSSASLVRPRSASGGLGARSPRRERSLSFSPLPEPGPLPQNPTPKTAAAPPKTKVSVEWKPKNTVLIHVIDDANQIRKDFECDRDLLVQSMQYFRSYLSDDDRGSDVDISVHCDASIFEWLSEYMNQNDPKLGPFPSVPHRNRAFLTCVDGSDVGNVVGILVSSDFLRMNSLVECALDFTAAHIGEIMRLPIDLSCLTPTMVTGIVRVRLSLPTSPLSLLTLQ